MKSVIAGLATFLIGLYAASLFHSETENRDLKTVETVTIHSEEVQTTVEVTLTRETFFDSFQKDDYFSGWFTVDEFKGMKEVWTILLSRDMGEDDNINRWTVMVLTSNTDGSSNDDDNFHAVSLQTKADRLDFRTNKIRGISYEFDGRFVRTGKDFTQGEKVLHGTFQKLVKGNVVSKFTTDFEYAEPHCFH